MMETGRVPVCACSSGNTAGERDGEKGRWVPGELPYTGRGRPSEEVTPEPAPEGSGGLRAQRIPRTGSSECQGPEAGRSLV